MAFSSQHPLAHPASPCSSSCSAPQHKQGRSAAFVRRHRSCFPALNKRSELSHRSYQVRRSHFSSSGFHRPLTTALLLASSRALFGLFSGLSNVVSSTPRIPVTLFTTTSGRISFSPLPSFGHSSSGAPHPNLIPAPNASFKSEAHDLHRVFLLVQ